MRLPLFLVTTTPIMAFIIKPEVNYDKMGFYLLTTVNRIYIGLKIYKNKKLKLQI